MQVVIVPAWRRPAFLLACLDRLEMAAAGRGDLRFLIALDRGVSDGVRQVARDFSRRWPGQTRVIRRNPHPYTGNSFNVLSAYREALQLWTNYPELVHLVEEDVLVGRDYFHFHDLAHKLAPDAFSVSACRNQNYPLSADPPQDDTAIYPNPMYQSIGVSFRPARLRQVAPHANPTYLRNPIGYCKRAWPNSRIPQAHAEQDGLLHRIAEASNLRTYYPLTPRAYHVGFVGYHRRGAELEGDVRTQADCILSMTADELNAVAYSYPDHNTIPLDGPREPVSRVVDIDWNTGGNFV